MQSDLELAIEIAGAWTQIGIPVRVLRLQDQGRWPEGFRPDLGAALLVDPVEFGRVFTSMLDSDTGRKGKAAVEAMMREQIDGA